VNILALDLGTKTGWSTNVNGRRSGTIAFDLRRGESPGMRFLRLRSWLNEMGSLLGDLDVIAFEQAHQRGGHATAVAYGLQGEVLAFAAEHGIETMPVHSSSLKKHATGSGRASKLDMIEAARARGWNPEDDNEADALHLLSYAEARL
jgi:hypothetical protein